MKIKALGLGDEQRFPLLFIYIFYLFYFLFDYINELNKCIKNIELLLKYFPLKPGMIISNKPYQGKSIPE